jgi:hypothetical protein
MASLQGFASDHPWALAASVALVTGTAAYLQSQHYKVCHYLPPHDNMLNVRGSQLRHIPTVGASSWPLLSYIGGRKYFDHGLEVLQEGYERVGCNFI